MSEAAKIIVIGIVSGCVAFAALLVFVFATGQTFGQRCAHFPVEARAQCVDDLSRGKSWSKP